MSALVYAYGCGDPISGTEHVDAEIERCGLMWDALVALDHGIAAKELALAAEESAQLADALRWLAIPAAGKWTDEYRKERRKRYQLRDAALKAWRKEHKVERRILEDERLGRLKQIRQSYTVQSAHPIYWGNSNRVLESYATGRQVASRKGRLIRARDPARKDAVLRVQIQRTRTGVGASPDEVCNGGFNHLQFSLPGATGYSHLSMRVDAAGHHIVLPLLMHRSLPPACRIKKAELVRRYFQGRARWRLCMTIDSPAPMRLRAATQPACVELDWSGQGELEVMRIGKRVWRLSERWMMRMDRIEQRCADLDKRLADALKRWNDDERFSSILALPTWNERLGVLAVRRETLPETQRQWGADTLRLRRQIEGERRHVLGDRNNLYQLWAREVVSVNPTLAVDDRDLSAIAHRERGENHNSRRHRAAVHILRDAIFHQAAKAGTPIVDASGKVLNQPPPEKSTAWMRRRDGKVTRLAGDCASG